jgi:hypothetical protein
VLIYIGVLGRGVDVPAKGPAVAQPAE